MILQYIASFISIFFDLLSFAILLRVILSWIDGNSGGGFIGRLKMILYDVTEPVLSVFRKIIPRAGMLDFSPIVAIIALDLLKVLILSLVSSL